MDRAPKSDEAGSFDELLKDAAATPHVGSRRRVKVGTTVVNGRFAIERELGEGGMGIVYQARDTKRGTLVALKMLSHLDASGIYRIKKEFRSLADVVHENLVGLHELFADEDEWFFTMDLVDGVPFIEYVRTNPALGFDETLSSDPAGAALDATLEAPAGVTGSRGSGALKETRLREALRQLAAAVSAIHGAGKLHCDLKPSNVLVARGGRIVILDFGLAKHHADNDATQTIERGIAGTPGYMAPEQALGEPATTASDWYAVGAMLYEALTRELPFTGRVRDVLARKQQHEPEPPSKVVSGVPGDLEELCMDLLRRDPAARPNGAEVSRRLGAGRPSPADAAADVPFVGREPELAALWDAFEAVRRGESKTVFVRGLSGMGKTTLVERFLARSMSEGRAIVLRGRCHEREEVPFKAVDGIVDALTRYLARLDVAAAALLLPRDLHTLGRVFPVLRRVPVIAQARSRVSAIEEPIELRRVAFRALRELLQRLGDQRPLVLFSDDLHWADAGSARLLSTVFEQPEAPAVLFIGAYRSDEVDRSAFLQAVQSTEGGAWKDAALSVDVRELESAQALELAAELLGPGGREQAAGIALEAAGHPYFVTELARGAGDTARDAPDRTAHRTLDGLISARIASLPDAMRRLLEVVALSGRPVPALVALDAAGNLAGRPISRARPIGRSSRAPDSHRWRGRHRGLSRPRSGNGCRSRFGGRADRSASRHRSGVAGGRPSGPRAPYRAPRGIGRSCRSPRACLASGSRSRRVLRVRNRGDALPSGARVGGDARRRSVIAHRSRRSPPRCRACGRGRLDIPRSRGAGARAQTVRAMASRRRPARPRRAH